MYFASKLAIDPSSVTDIKTIKPDKAFAKILNIITAGGFNKKEEHETYTAISIMQQFNIIFRKMGITNVVHIAQDEIDFYLDEEGKKDDLKEALESFKLNTDEVESSLFKQLKLVVEHEDANFTYLIQLEIKRIHNVGEYPIEIKVNGMLKDFMSKDENAVKDKMEPIFSNQGNYDSFLNEKKLHFNTFIDQLSLNLETFIKTDDIKRDDNNHIIRPNKNKRDQEKQPLNNREPVYAGYHGYYGYHDTFFYGMLWGSMMHSHHIHCHDTVIMNEHGDHLGDVGTDGFNAGDSDVLNSDTDFESIDHAGVSEFDGGSMGESVDDSSFFDGGSSEASCSSCSSCSSCGGGCGGD
jgi:hypothetical protein